MCLYKRSLMYPPPMENDCDPPPVENESHPSSGNNSVDPTEGIMYGDSSLPPQWKLIVAQLRSETEKYNGKHLSRT
jgi:hypothetical protein